MKMFNMSGSIGDWGHAPNLTPRDSEIKKDELYVVSGDTIIKAYHLLINQRLSTLLMLSKTPPTDTRQYEEYLSLSKYINSALRDLIQGLPLASILQMQNESMLSQSKSRSERVESLSLNQLLKKFHLSGGGKDEMKNPPPPDDSPAKE